ncbi:hypothetical protein [Selenomonas ruminantium]|jgi:hypothetical protein|uniref:hypothetical protein n=1 Tax=Selenomonas ruminantium TaxID=971 RepID=UPI001568E989|nr:hypothetical protein [Selenomonas ruminantium]
MQKRRLIIGGILGLVLAGGGVFWLNTSSNVPAQQQITETTVATRAENVPNPDKLTPPQAAQRQEKPAVKPIKDVFVYSLEGEQVFIVAGSVTADKKNHQWQAQIKNVNRKGQAQPVQSVMFKQEGNQILTCNADGKWRNIDEMDKTIFNKVVDISGTY